MKEVGDSLKLLASLPPQIWQNRPSLQHGHYGPFVLENDHGAVWASRFSLLHLFHCFVRRAVIQDIEAMNQVFPFPPLPAALTLPRRRDP